MAEAGEETCRVALVTGGNRGLGLAIARALGRMGMIVLIGSRDLETGEAVAAGLRDEGIDARALRLDVTRDTDIAAAPGWIMENVGRLDILVNNGGVQLDRDASGGINTGRAAFLGTFDANTIGPYLLTVALLPLLEASPAGRVVNHSSILGSVSVNADPDGLTDDWRLPAYNASKAALNLLTALLSRQLAATRIKVNAAHPGWVRTTLGGDAAPLGPDDGAKTAVWLATLPDDGPSGGFFHEQKTLPW